MFVALALYRFDISLATGEDGIRPPFPLLDDEKPTVGMMGPAAGNDVLVYVEQAKR